MWSRIRAIAVLMLVAVCIVKAPAQGSSAGSIVGQVADSAGALVPGAAVVAVQANTTHNGRPLPTARVLIFSRVCRLALSR